MASRGELEQRIMEVLWASDAPMSVADVHAVLNIERTLAYTTVMTVLDRLAKKKLVTRELVARAWRYQPGYTQAGLLAAELAVALHDVAEPVRRDALMRLGELLTEDDLAVLRG